jgi:Domain of unknown function (DUF6456)
MPSVKRPRKKAAAAATPGFNESENPVLRLFLRKDISGETYVDAEQLAAAERLRRDFEFSHLSPRTTMAYREPASSGNRYWQMSDNAIANLSDNAIAARERFARAMDTLGPELGSVAYNVCCLAGGFEHAEKRMALPPRSGKAVLSIALNLLARHYGLKRPVGVTQLRRR